MNDPLEHTFRAVLFSGFVLSLLLAWWRTSPLRRGWLKWPIDMGPHFLAFVHIVVAAVELYVENNVPMFALAMVGCYGAVRLLIRKAAEIREAAGVGDILQDAD